jgi:hypothetical protein
MADVRQYSTAATVSDLEAHAAGQECYAKLVEADTLALGLGLELSVQRGGQPKKELTAGFHTADSTACSIDRSSIADNTARMANMMEEFTLRMLGQDISLRRYAWLNLLDDLRPESELAGRIRELVA